MVQKDASDLGFGAVLMQEGHHVAYLSKPVPGKNQGLSIYEKECMAIILAVDKWRPYLQNQEFVIRTYHRSLLHLTEQRVATKLQHKALLKLMDLQFKIVFKQGSTNMAADALSRYPEKPAIAAISTCVPSWVDRLKEGYQDDSDTSKLLSDLQSLAGLFGDFTLTDGLIRF